MKYSIGLDIGITSCGWSVINLDKKRIEDLGVRIFNAAEDPQKHTSLALPRREKRSSRRRFHRRRARLNYLKQFFIELNLLDKSKITQLLTPHKGQLNPYILREKALEEKLSTDELLIALYHIAKRRGYKSNRRAESSSDENENKKTLHAISENQKLLIDYQTVTKALNQNEKFAAHKRNKPNDYSNSFARADFESEITTILNKQAEFYPELTEEKINDLLYRQNYGLFFQRPFMSPELIAKMRGNCQFEKDTPRAQKASVSFEIFRLASDLAHLTYNNGQKLTSEEITTCIEKAKEVVTFKYSHIDKILNQTHPEEIIFDYIRGLKKKDLNSDTDEAKKKALNQKFSELKFYHAIKKALANLPEEWQKLEKNLKLFNEIGFILTANKEDESIIKHLKELNLSKQAIENITSIKQNFTGFCHLSILALDKITPYILEGNTYDKAVVLAGYNFNDKLSGDQNRLPALTEEESQQITNPVTKRAVSQTIKVVNAIIHKYGAPTRLHIECASELAKSYDKRRQIEDNQKDNQATNQKIVDILKNEYHIVTPNYLQITKYKLYLEQDGKCLYSNQPIDLDRLFTDEHYCEIDHIIPKSRCGNDSLINKALVFNRENQEKRNQTPFEAWGGDTERWQQFKTNVQANLKIHPRKKLRLLAEVPPKEDWNSRALNDTRYITRFLSNYFKQHLKFSEDSHGRKKVFTPTGGITSYLRRVWHVGSKDRSGNLHHAVDATIIALVTEDIIKQCALMNKYIELGANYATKGINLSKFHHDIHSVIDPVTGEIIDLAGYEKIKEEVLPWPNFDTELRFRATPLAIFVNELPKNKKEPKPELAESAKLQQKNKSINTLAEWRDQFREIYNDQDELFKNSIHPIFVSRMPKRKGTGSLHQDTVRSPKGIIVDPKTQKITTNPNRSSYIRANLENIKLADLENSIIKTDDKSLYQQLKQLLEENDNDPKKAFKEPVYKNNIKVDKNGKPLSPVRTIKLIDDKNVKSGILLSRGTQFVNNGSMVRVDIYQKEVKGKNQLFYVPIYTHQVKKGSTRILPTTCGYDYVDETFKKLFSLYPNDYIIMKKDNNTIQGYYIKYNTSNSVITHISNLMPGSTNFKETTGRSLTEIYRLDISILGDNYPWEKLY